jgi:hypothetical protein
MQKIIKKNKNGEEYFVIMKELQLKEYEKEITNNETIKELIFYRN